MKFEIKALATNVFKALVTVNMPLNEVDENGNTKYGKAEFVGRFQALPVNAARKHLNELQELRDQNKHKEALDLSANQMNEYFIGFEPKPGTELPFTNEGQPLESNADNIALLLNSKEVREAVAKAYHAARDTALEGN